MSAATVVAAEGGAVDEFALDGIVYRSHRFAQGSDEFIVTSPGVVDFLVVGGGGGGGGSDASGWGAGGGGGGGVVVGSFTAEVGVFPVVAGAGGLGQTAESAAVSEANRGGDSSFAGRVALGGGVGSGRGRAEFASGGSGGGAGPSADFLEDPGSAVGGAPAQPNSPSGGFGSFGGGGSLAEVPFQERSGGGGGGAGGPGLPASFGNGGAGGEGLPSRILGERLFFAAGGGGGASAAGVAGPGGAGGGGAGMSSGASGAPGVAGTGSGGGGASASGGAGGAGGSGTVVVRYPVRQLGSPVLASATSVRAAAHGPDGVVLSVPDATGTSKLITESGVMASLGLGQGGMRIYSGVIDTHYLLAEGRSAVLPGVLHVKYSGSLSIAAGSNLVVF